jgi:putative transposase
MPYRNEVLAPKEIYHIFNRGVAALPIYLVSRSYLRFLDLVDYYRFSNTPFSFSSLLDLPREERMSLLARLRKENAIHVEILAFCLMPNHFHFLLKQLTDKGISKFIAKITNGFSHYFNIRHDRSGHLFQGNFGAVRIEDDEQFMHVSRYIHLNPVTSYLIGIENLSSYESSSYPEYIDKSSGFTNVKESLSYFNDPRKYKEFVEDHADYSKKLADIEHLTLEDLEYVGE